MPPDTIEECHAEIESLQKEIKRLRNAHASTLSATLAVVSDSGSLTIPGIEEMIIEIKPDDTIGYVNTPMARLLGMPDKKIGINTPIAKWDRGPLGDGILTALADIVRDTGEQQLLERSCPGIDPKLLPGVFANRPSAAAVLRFVASLVKGRVHIVVQEVTLLRWLEKTFSRYVSSAVIEKMQALKPAELLSMERKELSVMFGDLRGFTRMSQQLEPEAVQEVVNSFLANMVECVDRLEGTVDKFVGDEIMVIFGAPIAQEDHALRALICAVEMQKAHSCWMEDQASRGKPARPLGLGLATGHVVVGNVGTESRMDYTVLGHTVNLAARLCGSAEGGEILTVPRTHTVAMKTMEKYAARLPIPRFSFRPKGQMSFKNVSDPVEVISVTTK